MHDLFQNITWNMKNWKSPNSFSSECNFLRILSTDNWFYWSLIVDYCSTLKNPSVLIRSGVACFRPVRAFALNYPIIDFQQFKHICCSAICLHKLDSNPLIIGNKVNDIFQICFNFFSLKMSRIITICCISEMILYFFF